jgi:hypothetical protein
MSTICMTSNERTDKVKCENPSQHRAVLSNGKEIFSPSVEEFNYWEKIQRNRRENMRREYLETGECLLCIIDKSILGKF